MDRHDDRSVIATTIVRGPADLARVRRLLAASAASAGLPADRVDQFTVALSEVATNAIRHANGSATITITTSGAAVTVEVRDRGTGLPRDVRATRPDPAQVGGRGLWLAAQLCDDLHVTSSSSGTTVRMTMRP